MPQLVRRRLSRLVAALVAGAALIGVAHAQDFLVVRSTDAAVPPGLAFSRGDVLKVGVGSEVILVDADGRPLRYAAGAHRLPPAQTLGRVDLTRLLAALPQLVSPPPPRREVGGTRDLNRYFRCLPFAEGASFEQALAAHDAGCADEAHAAFNRALEAR